MRKRAEQVDATRQRIVEATVKLHEQLGPGATTIAGIAAEADVTRVTVYRHFPDDEALFAACTAHWMARQQPPDPDAWASIGDAEARLRQGLHDLYRFYRQGERMLTGVYRDRDTLPPAIQRTLDSDHRRAKRRLLEPFDASGPARRRLSALIGHAASFWTWRSLCVDERLSNREAVEMMTTLVLASAAGASASP